MHILGYLSLAIMYSVSRGILMHYHTPLPLSWTREHQARYNLVLAPALAWAPNALKLELGPKQKYRRTCFEGAESICDVTLHLGDLIIGHPPNPLLVLHLQLAETAIG